MGSVRLELGAVCCRSGPAVRSLSASGPMVVPAEGVLGRSGSDSDPCSPTKAALPRQEPRSAPEAAMKGWEVPGRRGLDSLPSMTG